MDLTRDQLMAQAEQTILVNGGPDVAFVHFKFTCSQCGERCILAEPNTLYERGECMRCGLDQPIRAGGFMLILKIVPDAPPRPMN